MPAEDGLTTVAMFAVGSALDLIVVLIILS